ncbi:MAG: hypothetical protein ACE14M_07040 [Terriglobales bacterium]
MPYEISFTKKVTAADEEQYINPCCYGGDIVSNQLLPSIRKSYSDIQAGQEDWGWFIWFRSNGVALTVDIFCDDPTSGEFRIHLTSRTKGLLWSSKIVDTAELEGLCSLVQTQLSEWVGAPVKVERLDAKYM